MSTDKRIQKDGPSEPYTIFTRAQKAVIVSVVSGAATLSGFASNIYFPAIPAIATDLSVSTELVNLTVTCYMIFQALSPTIWGALSDVRGRRIAYVCTLTIFLGACIGLAETRTYAQIIILRCLQSTGSASTIAIGAGVIGDITTREERGGYMGLFQGGLLMPVAIGPVIGGALADHLGWRSVFWFLTIYGAVCLVIIVIILPETLRSLVGNGSRPASGLAKSPLASYQRKEYERANETCTKDGPIEHLPPKSIDWVGPLKILISLNAAFVILLVSVHYMTWQMVLTALSTLFKKVYRLDETQIGLVFLSNGVGSILGTLLTGKLLDIDYRRIRRQFDGDESKIPLERARMRTIWLWSGLECASVLVFGWTVHRAVHMSVPIISVFILGWTAISIQSVVSTFLVDVYPQHSASAMAALNLARCLCGAGGTAVVGPCITGVGVGWTFTIFAAIMFTSGGLLIVQMIHGPAWRQRLENKQNNSRT